ncbi:MAG: hypothetical protein IJS47_00780 [Clostridia bacterium]|nr:hypothetical protein [Clostridia bacterium]
MKKLNKFLIALICNMQLFLLTFSNAVVPRREGTLLFWLPNILVACIFILRTIIEITNKSNIKIIFLLFVEFVIVSLAIIGVVNLFFL